MENIFFLTKSPFVGGALRLTPQRQAIIRILSDKKNKHLTAEDIHRALSEQGQKLGIATVYRNLVILEKLGVVNKLDLGGGRSRYEFISNPNLFHYHLVCLNCGDIVEVEDLAFYQVIKQTAEQQGFEINQVGLTVIGYCQNCH